MATIYDVAQRAGVSTKTVSRVLNQDAPVAEQTRSAVLDAMQALEYVPSNAARAMKSRKSGLIGLITGAISTVDAETASVGLPDIHIVQGIQDALETSGKTLLISDIGERPERVPELVRTFREHRVEGLLYVADYHKEVSIPIPDDAVATVLVNCFDNRGTPAVVPDDQQGQHALTRAVIEMGHKRIAYLTLAADHVATCLRLRGFKAAMKAAGLPIDYRLIAAADRAGKDGEHALIRQALDRFLSVDEPPTAICCGNDRLAMAVYGILRERGISIPEEISVIGYDDHKLIAEMLYPALTTGELPYAEMGRQAALLLLELIDKPQHSSACNTPVQVTGRVCLRDSLTMPQEVHT